MHNTDFRQIAHDSSMQLLLGDVSISRTPAGRTEPLELTMPSYLEARVRLAIAAEAGRRLQSIPPQRLPAAHA